jgi:hypothetical protein
MEFRNSLLFDCFNGQLTAARYGANASDMPKLRVGGPAMDRDKVSLKSLFLFF